MRPVVLHGKDSAELERAALILQGFMQALMDDPVVDRVLDAIDITPAVEAVAREAAEMGSALAARLGLSGPSELFDRLSPASAEPEMPSVDDADAEEFERWVAALEELDALLDVDRLAPQVHRHAAQAGRTAAIPRGGGDPALTRGVPAIAQPVPHGHRDDRGQHRDEEVGDLGARPGSASTCRRAGSRCTRRRAASHAACR
jgi:hypothetical protein